MKMFPRFNRTIAAGSAAVAIAVAAGALIAPAPVAAQTLGICPSLVMPPPCIVFDYKKLGDIATQSAQEVQKIQETINTITQVRNGMCRIGQGLGDLRQLGISLNPPGIDNLEGPLIQAASGSLLAMTRKVGNEFFAGEGASTDQQAETRQVRDAARMDGNTEAYAYRLRANEENRRTEEAIQTLGRALERSTSLRQDWIVNSQIKEQLIGARAQQNFLWTAFLKMQSANSLSDMRTDMPRGFEPGSVAETAAPQPGPNDEALVQQLNDLLVKAQSALGSLAVVQMSNALQGSIQSIIADHESAVERRDNLMRQFQAKAAEWARHSGRSNAQAIVNTALSRLAAMDSQMASLRGQSIEALAGAFAQRNIDVAAMTQNDVDPRQFIGTWTDPLKYQNARSLANELLNGPLDKAISGDDDNDEFRQLLADYNDVRLEEAWKKVYADEARQLLEQTNDTVRQENELQKAAVTADWTTSQLQQIVAQANQIGQQIGNGEDQNAKDAARKVLEQLQELVSGGTSLPSVDAAPAEPAQS